jgi:drug/metabolite transporter (DMT)-like permease
LKAWKAELLLVLVTFIWGCTFLFTKQGIIDCSPSLYIIIRFGIALIVCLAFFRRHLLKIDRKTFKQGLILGIMFGCGFALQTYGLKYTTVSKSAFITGTCVVLTPFVFWFVERKKIYLWQKLGVAVATIGLWIFTDPDFDNLNWGDVMTLGSTFFWAFDITYMDVFTRDRSKFAETIQLVATQFVGALPVAFVTFLLFDINNVFFYPTTNLIVSLAFNGFIASFLATLMQTSIQKYSTPVKAALIFSIEPLVATAAAFIVLNEKLASIEIIGGIILFSGVLISEIGELSLIVYIQILKMMKKIE